MSAVHHRQTARLVLRPMQADDLDTLLLTYGEVCNPVLWIDRQANRAGIM